MKEKLVFSSRDITEANYICLILKENDIPYNKEIEGAGEYFSVAAGNTFNNEIRIFVNDDDYLKASELITTLNKTNDPMTITEIPDELKDIPPEEEKEMEEMATKTKENFKKLIKYFMIYPALLCIVYAIIMSILQCFKK